MTTRLLVGVFAGLSVLLPMSVAQAALPGGNGKIVYTTVFPSEPGAVVMSANGAGKRSLHTNFAEDDPVWSPEGTQIAVTADNAKVSVLSFPAAVDTLLANRGYDPSWSPDGGRIAFGSARTGNRELWVMSSDGSGETRLTFRRAADIEPAWSPNGRRIAFASDADGDWDIFVMSAVPGARATKLTRSDDLEAYPAWSPNGRRLAFTSKRKGNWDIYVMRAVPGAPARRLTRSSEREVDPAWSPDGSKLLFAGRNKGTWDIYKINVDGTGRRNLTRDERDDFFPDWQPVCTVRGTVADDPSLDGTVGADLICALGGNDGINGLGGNDSIFAGDGNDVVAGGSGADVIVGGPGADQLAGGAGADLINAKDGAGGDTITGDGSDLCLADAGDSVSGCTPAASPRGPHPTARR